MSSLLRSLPLEKKLVGLYNSQYYRSKIVSIWKLRRPGHYVIPTNSDSSLKKLETFLGCPKRFTHGPKPGLWGLQLMPGQQRTIPSSPAFNAPPCMMRTLKQNARANSQKEDEIKQKRRGRGGLTCSLSTPVQPNITGIIHIISIAHTRMKDREERSHFGKHKTCPSIMLAKH